LNAITAGNSVIHPLSWWLFCAAPRVVQAKAMKRTLRRRIDAGE
jgi:hypothetical protein